MALDFPSSPTNGQVYGNYYYNSARGAWNALLPAATPNFFTGAQLIDASVTSSAISTTPLTVIGLSGQTANLQEWKNSAGTDVVTLASNGAIVTIGSLTVSGSGLSTQLTTNNLIFSRNTASYISNTTAGGYIIHNVTTTTSGDTQVLSSSSSGLRVNPSSHLNSGTVPMVVKGSASQTADLQQWQSSTGAVLSEINSAGELQAPRIGVGATMPTTTMLQSTASAVGNIPIVARGAASQTANLQEWQNSSGTALSYLSPAGHFISPGINWIMLSAPVVSEFSFTGTVNTSWTLNAAVPTNARYVLANIFITASISDHQNFVLSATQWTNAKNWVDTRGSQPSAQFGTMTQKDHLTLTYFGETDGFSSNYGIWYNSLDVPTTGRTVWVNNNGNSGSNGWLYFVIRGYSL